MTPAFLHNMFSNTDFGTVGGSLLMADMFLFALLAANWEAAGRRRLFARRRPSRKR